MKDHNLQTIGDLIKVFLKRHKLDEKMEEVDLYSRWKEVVGPVIASHTTELRLKSSVLIIKLNSAALRHTLAFSKTELMEKINLAIGKELVKEIDLK